MTEELVLFRMKFIIKVAKGCIKARLRELGLSDKDFQLFDYVSSVGIKGYHKRTDTQYNPLEIIACEVNGLFTVDVLTEKPIVNITGRFQSESLLFRAFVNSGDGYHYTDEDFTSVLNKIKRIIQEWEP